MTKRHQNVFLYPCWLGCLALALFANVGHAEQPNILFIYLDDFGWKDAGYMGSDFYETPHIDALARSGMVFTNAYSCASNCAPARACLLSGQYTPRHKIYNVGTRARGEAAFRRLQHVPGVKTLDKKIRTWAHQLQSAGYATASIGKWHLSSDPIPHGFDVNVGGTMAGSPPKGYYPPHGRVPNLENAPADEYLTDRLSEETIKFIRNNKDQPWMVYLTHFAVHIPLQAKKELVAKYKVKPGGQLHDSVSMATMIQAVDDGVGKITDAIGELGLTDNTVVIFYSDNGGHGPATDMAPLWGYKGTYYEGGIRVPFFVSWPGVVKAGSSSAEPITGVDIYPTLCEIGGAEIPKEQPIDGVSLVGLFRGEVASLANAAGPRAIFWHFPAYLQSTKVWDEQRDPLFRTRPCGIIRKGKWKLHEYFESGDLELYDLESDEGESRNQAATHPEQAASLLKEMRQWRRSIGADMPRKLNGQFDAKAEAKAIKGRLDKSFQPNQSRNNL